MRAVHAGLTLQTRRATIDSLQDSRPLFHYVNGISGILPYNQGRVVQSPIKLTHG